MFQYLMNINLYGHSQIHYEYLAMCGYTRFNTFCVYMLEVIQIQYVQIIATIYTCVVKATAVNLTRLCNPRRLHILHDNNNNNIGYNEKFGNEKIISFFKRHSWPWSLQFTKIVVLLLWVKPN